MEKMEIPIDEVRALIKAAKGCAKSDFAKKFVSDQEERIKKYGDNTWFSEKQIAVLQKIANGGAKMGAGDE